MAAAPDWQERALGSLLRPDTMDLAFLDAPFEAGALRSGKAGGDASALDSLDAARPAMLGPQRSLMPNLSEVQEHLKIVHGTTTLAFKYKDGVVVAVDSRASAGAYIASQNVKKVIEINQFLLGTMAGGAADCQYWQRYLGMRCRLFELNHKERISVAAASKLFQNILYGYRGYGLSIGTMVAGWDHKGPGLYYLDSEGARIEGNLFSVGSGSLFAYGILDSNYKYDMEFDAVRPLPARPRGARVLREREREADHRRAAPARLPAARARGAQAIELGRRAIYHATHNDAYSGGTVRVYHIDGKGWRRISEDDSAVLHYQYNPIKQ